MTKGSETDSQIMVRGVMVCWNPAPSTDEALSPRAALGRPFRGLEASFMLFDLDKGDGTELGDAVPLSARLGLGVVGSGNGRGWCRVETMVEGGSRCAGLDQGSR